ncbi:hypothetical protein E3J62_09495 [candidate division TA06 bacterium]|uniref:WD40 repeat domain-containing protein n=1 Tax=candidate division TA06 bacterium TaxID=2250710 RepID=A0A523UQF1_UNCT6|nr:MAG: hypothetical protein E3J62_09495 [candidate division TA06 bacterium]
MKGLGRCFVCIAVLVSLCGAIYGTPGAPPKSGKTGRELPEKGPLCVSVYVPSSEKARELCSLGIKCKGPGSLVVWISEQLLSKLESRGYDLRLTSFGIVEKATLDEGIWDVYMGRKTETEAARPVLGRFRKESSTGKKLVAETWFFDRALAVSAVQPDLAGAIVSKHSEYVGLFRPGKDRGKGPRGRWEVFDKSGQKTGEIEVPALWEGFSSWMIVSDVGNSVGVEELDDLWLSFHARDGKLIRRLKAREDDESLISTNLDISEDGEYLLLQVARHRTEESDPIAMNEVVAYNLEGDELWRFMPEDQLTQPSCVSVSRDGSYTVSSFREPDARAQGRDKRVTYLLDSRGGMIRRMEGFSPTQVKFSLTQEHVVLLHPREGVVLLSLPSGEEMFRYDTNAALRDFDLAEQGRVVGLIEHGSVVLLDFNGRKLWQAQFADIKPTEFAKISLSADGKEFSLAAGGRLHVYRQVR